LIVIVPEFDNLRRVLERKKPHRPVLFEYFMNQDLYCDFAHNLEDQKPGLEQARIFIEAFMTAGYDYVLLPTWNLEDFKLWHNEPLVFPVNDFESASTRSLNAAAIILDRESFRSYPWPDPDQDDYSLYRDVARVLPDGMKLIISGTSGVLETAIDLVGYERLCYMSLEDKNLMGDIFDEIGSRILRYYQICASIDNVGVLLGNDDWGFRSQTMLSPEILKKYVFPWHKRIVDVIHQAGKYAILHSCGNLDAVMDDIIHDMKYDGKHSFEDAILPVEEAYALYSGRIAIIGGIDLHFLCSSSPREVYLRSKKMLELSAEKGAFALGSGNSIPNYVPLENYKAMIRAAHDYDGAF
jgi:uroporphyrinogen decarboxylase